jgi:hypothetical protein
VDDMDKVRCNNCMTVMSEESIKVVDNTEVCPNCNTDGCIMDLDKIDIVCSTCGSNDIRRNADCIWNTVKQAWEVVSLFDSFTCESCGTECNVSERKI